MNKDQLVRALVIPVRGSVYTVDLHGPQAVYSAVVTAVGPTICSASCEVLRTSLNCYVNDTGLVDGLPWNPRASALYDDPIAGPMIVFGPLDATGNETSVPEHIVEYVKALRDY